MEIICYLEAFGILIAGIALLVLISALIGFILVKLKIEYITEIDESEASFGIYFASGLLHLLIVAAIVAICVGLIQFVMHIAESIC